MFTKDNNLYIYWKLGQVIVCMINKKIYYISNVYA